MCLWKRVRPWCRFTLKVWGRLPMRHTQRWQEIGCIFMMPTVRWKGIGRMTVMPGERCGAIGCVFMNVFVCSFFGTLWTPTAQTHPLKQTPTQHTHHLCDHEHIHSTWLSSALSGRHTHTNTAKGITFKMVDN